jgi:hypothetical protein
MNWPSGAPQHRAQMDFVRSQHRLRMRHCGTGWTAFAVGPPKPKGTLMAGERELISGLLSKETNSRLIVSGTIGVKEIEMLIKKLELDKEILADDTDVEKELTQ